MNEIHCLETTGTTSYFTHASPSLIRGACCHLRAPFHQTDYASLFRINSSSSWIGEVYYSPEDDATFKNILVGIANGSTGGEIPNRIFDGDQWGFVWIDYDGTRVQVGTMLEWEATPRITSTSTTAAQATSFFGVFRDPFAGGANPGTRAAMIRAWGASLTPREYVEERNSTIALRRSNLLLDVSCGMGTTIGANAVPASEGGIGNFTVTGTGLSIVRGGPMLPNRRGLFSAGCGL